MYVNSTHDNRTVCHNPVSGLEVLNILADRSDDANGLVARNQLHHPGFSFAHKRCTESQRTGNFTPKPPRWM